MALKLEIITEHGVSVEYWRIGKIHLRYELVDETGLETGDRAYITLEGYVAKANRDAGNKAFMERSVSIRPVPGIHKGAVDVREVFYPEVKKVENADPDWTKATDVFEEAKT